MVRASRAAWVGGGEIVGWCVVSNQNPFPISVNLAYRTTHLDSQTVGRSAELEASTG